MADMLRMVQMRYSTSPLSISFLRYIQSSSTKTATATASSSSSSLSGCLFSSSSSGARYVRYASSTPRQESQSKQQQKNTAQKQDVPNQNNTFRYGTQAVIRTKSHLPHPPNHPLAPYIQHSINQYHQPITGTNNDTDTSTDSNNDTNTDTNTNINPSSKNLDSTFNITFLGTSGGGTPNSNRNPSSTTLRLDGTMFLFDCGEGSIKQISFSKMTLSDINKIFITHLHLDHVGGLISLILNIKLCLDGSFKKKKPNNNNNNNNNSNNNNNNRKKKGFENRSHSSSNQKNNDGSGDTDSDGDTVSDTDGDQDDVFVLELYGPIGLYNYIAMNLALTHSNLYPMKVIVYEMLNEYENDPNSNNSNNNNNNGNGNGNDHDKSNSNKKGKKQRTRYRHHKQKVFHHEYSEIWNPYLERRILYKNTSNTWIIQRGQEEQALSKNNKTTPGRNIHKKVHIEAALVRHVPNVQTFGYAVTEPTPQPKIDSNKAIALGIKPSPKYRLLKDGQSVLNDDGTDTVHSHQVLCDDGNGNTLSRKGRKFVLIGDTCAVPDSMIGISKDCDVLIHEATLTKELAAEAIHRGHSTAEMAGQVAKKVNAKALMLNHISARIDDQHSIDELVASAVDGSDSSCSVAVSYDFMELTVPRDGFNL